MAGRRPASAAYSTRRLGGSPVIVRLHRGRLEGREAQLQVRFSSCEVSLVPVVSVVPLLFVRNLFLLSRPFIASFFLIESFGRAQAGVFFRFVSFTLQYSVA